MPFPIMMAAAAAGTSTVAVKIFWSIIGICSLGYLVYPEDQELPLPSSPLTGIIKDEKQKAIQSEAEACAILPIQEAKQLSLGTASIKESIENAHANIADTVKSIDNLPETHTELIDNLGQLSQSQRQIHGFFQKIHADFEQIKPPSEAQDEMMDLQNHIVFLKTTIKTKDEQIDDYQKQIQVLMTIISPDAPRFQP